MRKTKKQQSILFDDAMARVDVNSESVCEESDELPLIMIQDGFTDWSELDPEPGTPDAVEIPHEEVMAYIDAKYNFPR